MSGQFSPEELDRDVEQLVQAGVKLPADEGSLLAIASELRRLPSAQFRQQLRDDLLAQTENFPPLPKAEFPLQSSEGIPSLSQRQFSLLPADPRSFIFSFLSHAAAVVLIASGIWVSRTSVVKTTSFTPDLTYIPVPPGDTAPHGGGGGGDHSPVQVSHGAPPDFRDEQLAPPAVVVRNRAPKLQVPPAVLGPPQIKLPQSDKIGDLLSPNVAIPSSGAGRRGMGSGSGSGVGIGKDAGVGPGSIAGFGGEAYWPGNGVSAPKAIYDPDPEYSDQARRAKYQGHGRAHPHCGCLRPRQEYPDCAIIGYGLRREGG
jgi:periplasmic protein TonB